MSLGIVLLIFLIGLSVIGTFNSKIFVSPWFLGSSGLLTLNLLGCTAERTRRLWRKDSSIPAVLQTEGQYRSLTLPQCSPDRAVQAAMGELKGLGFKVKVRPSDSGHLITGQKNSWGTMGSPLLHLALVLIIVGSVVGGLWGHRGYYEVEVPGTLKLTQDGFPFDLQVKKFNVETYQDGSPKQYTSWLEVLTNNRPVIQRAISVNHPLNYQGVKVYQTSYGYILQGAVRDGQHSFDFKVQEGQRIFIGGPTKLELEVQWPRYLVYSEGVPYTMGIAQLNEPVKLLNAEIVFTNRIPYTGLQVKTDPGLPIIWLGFILLLVGLVLRLYMRPNAIWVLLAARAEGTVIRLAAAHRVRGQEEAAQLMQKLGGIIPEECSLNT